MSTKAGELHALEASELLAINGDAGDLGIPQDFTTRVVEAARAMAQSSWVDAADMACNVAGAL